VPELKVEGVNVAVLPLIVHEAIFVPPGHETREYIPLEKTRLIETLR